MTRPPEGMAEHLGGAWRKRALAVLAPAVFACCSKAPPGDAPAPSASSSPPAMAEPPPRMLYLPDAASPPAASAFPAPRAPGLAVRCPPEMVDVHASFCIDRFESTLVDARTGLRLSPYYHPTAEATRQEYRRWQRAKLESTTPEGRRMAVPAPPEWQLSARTLEPVATSVADSIPNGYLSGQIAEQACERAGKRLCTVEQWVTACRGQQNRAFPHGHLYEDGRCNVFRATHPALLLHGDSSSGHADPRLNQVDEDGEPLLRPAGATPACASEWGPDSVHDLVGNLDEWVDDPEGTFVGGFYSRATRQGCDARVEVHSYDYHDYSLGARCCK